MNFFFESGKGHAIKTCNAEYSHVNTSVKIWSSIIIISSCKEQTIT
jgi:hypothetical protein